MAWNEKITKRRRRLVATLVRECEARGITGNARIAAVAGVGENAIRQWRNGQATPKNEEMLKLAIDVVRKDYPITAAPQPDPKPDRFPQSDDEATILGRGIQLLQGLDPTARKRVANFWKEYAA